MNQLTLEPVCDSQDHIYIQRNGNDNCNICSKKLTNYRCKNCYRELCNTCHKDMILNARSDQLKRTKNLLLEERKKIRQQDIQLNNDYRDTIDRYNGKSQKIIVRDRRGRRNSYNKSSIIYPTNNQLVGRKLSEKPRNRSLSCFEKLFKYR